jgi:hypothetical protein
MSDRPVDLSRRRLLIGALGSVAAIGLGSWPLGGVISRLWEVDRRAELHGLIHDRTTAAALGQRYLLIAPREADEDRLIGFLTDRHSIRPVREQVSARIAEDFTGGRTLRLDGWIVSRSEARLFALAALS